MLKKDQKYIEKEILKLVQSDFSGEIEVEEFDGVKVKFDGENAVIGCNSKVQFARGVFLLAKDYKNGAFEITQKPNFDLLGVSIDVSRNGVYTVDTLKKWIVNLAALGFTHASLYMEDVFELEGYSFFGYMRGRYTKDELKEFDSFAEKFGIDIIPTFQSLAHLSQYLQWEEASPIKDTANCLLVDEPKTYEFIEKIISTLRECFPRATQINICADEANDLGRGKFLKRNGYEPQQSILVRHVHKVYEICKKYDFVPFMYSDMFYRSLSKNGWYYDKDVKLTAEMGKAIPQEMGVCYWDYYHTKKEDYDYFIKDHQNLNHQIIMLGGIWTWEGFVEDTVQTYNASVPFLRSAIEQGEKQFMAAFWGDYGNETNYFHSISSLAIISEFCYRGVNCTGKEISEISEFLTGVSLERKLEISKVYSYFHEDYKFSNKHIYGDMFFDLVNINYDYEKAMIDVAEAVNKCKEYMNENDRNRDFYELCYYVAKVTLQKIELINTIRPAYKNKNNELLHQIAEEKIPAFLRDGHTFKELFKKDWLKYKKSNGIEVVLLRIAAALEEASFRKEQLEAYLAGETDKITELEEEVIKPDHKVWDYRLFSPSTWRI